MAAAASAQADTAAALVGLADAGVETALRAREEIEAQLRQADLEHQEAVEHRREVGEAAARQGSAHAVGEEGVGDAAEREVPEESAISEAAKIMNIAVNTVLNSLPAHLGDSAHAVQDAVSSKGGGAVECIEALSFLGSQFNRYVADGQPFDDFEDPHI